MMTRYDWLDMLSLYRRMTMPEQEAVIEAAIGDPRTIDEAYRDDAEAFVEKYAPKGEE